MKAIVDKDLCIGCGLCVSTCPEVFKMEEDKAIAFVSVAPKAAEDMCKRAVDECPVTAIILK